MPKTSWLRQQFEKANYDVNSWPAWMQREAAKMNNKNYSSSTHNIAEKNIPRENTKEANNKK